MSAHGDSGFAAPDDVVVAISEGRTVRIASGSSLTLGSGADASCRIHDDSVAPMHARIDNRVVPAGYDASHPYCRMVWVADIGGASTGDALFGPGSRTGVITDPRSKFIVPLEYGEVAPLRTGALVLLGHVAPRIVSGARDDVS